MSAPVIPGDAVALAVARGLADEFRKGAAEPDAGSRTRSWSGCPRPGRSASQCPPRSAARTWTRTPSRARWKVQHIGRYVLSGTRPPRHGLL
ncbi:hypothetical protein [Streptomyces werraensis]|uniref:hypothetical protein n=1 Tax=Streptomyces werraensis TaxID=68284 RepID=UPI001CE341F9